MQVAQMTQQTQQMELATNSTAVGSNTMVAEIKLLDQGMCV